VSRLVAWGNVSLDEVRRVFETNVFGSKVALNALTVGFAADLETAAIKVNSADPGLTARSVSPLAAEPAPTTRRQPTPFAL
jgi:NAD(P)-dependent dehydrogenase (short-subunit alcohol dehydrogenase family)